MARKLLQIIIDRNGDTNRVIGMMMERHEPWPDEAQSYGKMIPLGLRLSHYFVHQYGDNWKSGDKTVYKKRRTTSFMEAVKIYTSLNIYDDIVEETENEISGDLGWETRQ